MATMQEVQAVITANRELQAQARNLNIRAGEEVFPVLGSQQFKEWLAGRLNGAVSVATIVNVEMIRLPSMEQEMVNLVLSENPDTVTVLDRQFAISYRSGYQPSITLEGNGVTTSPYIWRNLPDEGVKLPGGRLIQVACKIGYWDSISDSNIPQLKEKVRNHLNREQWGSWSVAGRPVIVLPDLEAENAFVSDIITAHYGTCVVEDTPLLAYGTAVVKSSRFFSSDPWFEARWYQKESEAQAANAQARAKLEEIREGLKEELRLSIFRTAATQARERLAALCSQYYYQSGLEAGLRDRMEERRYQPLPATVVELKQWTADTQSISAEVEAAVAVLEQKKEERERQIRKFALPILLPEQTETSGTVYAMPCNSSGPCEEKSATMWRLYSYDQGKLKPHKGLRSYSYGSNFAELVQSYLAGDPNRIKQVIARNEGGEIKKVGAGSPELDLSMLKKKWGAK